MTLTSNDQVKNRVGLTLTDMEGVDVRLNAGVCEGQVVFLVCVDGPASPYFRGVHEEYAMLSVDQLESLGAQFMAAAQMTRSATQAARDFRAGMKLTED